MQRRFVSHSSQVYNEITFIHTADPTEVEPNGSTDKCILSR